MNTLYDAWYEANREDLKEAWRTMGDVEKFEMSGGVLGNGFETFCQSQYEDSRDFSNSSLLPS